jgi:hypothetical protein
MADIDQDLSISQLPPLTLPVQGSDLLHIARGGEDFRISRTELVRMLFSQLSDASISGTTSGQTLVYNSVSGKWANGFVAWATVSGKPGTFPPTAHTHLWDEITDAPTSLPAEAHSHAWTDLTDVPSFFPPEEHLHGWDEITAKPTAFPPEEHDHSSLYYTKTQLDTPGGGGAVDWDNVINVPDLGSGSGDMTKAVYDPLDTGIVQEAYFAYGAGSVMWDVVQDRPEYFPPEDHNHDVHWDSILDKPTGFGIGDMTKAEFDEDSDGVIDYVWTAQYAMVALAIQWEDVFGTPATFPPDAHNHDELYSLLAHNHDAVYSLLAHTHAGIVASQIASASWVTGIELTTMDRLGVVIDSSGVLKALAVDELAEWMKIANLNYSYASKTHTHTNYLTDAPSDTKTYGRKNGAWAEVVASAGGAWGSITGTLSAQTDLQTALDGKSATSHNHSHTALTSIGTNTHDQIDQHISNAAPHSGHSVVGHQHTARLVLVMHGNSATLTSGQTMYLCPGLNGLVALNGVPLPLAGTIKNLTVKTNSTQPASGTLVLTVQKGAVDQAVVVTVPTSGGANSYQDSTHSVSWIAGEVLGIKLKNNATAASCQISGVTVEFQVATI